MPLLEDTKAIVASNLVIAQELRRLVLATQDHVVASDYSDYMLAIFSKIMKTLD